MTGGLKGRKKGGGGGRGRGGGREEEEEEEEEKRRNIRVMGKTRLVVKREGERQRNGRKKCIPKVHVQTVV